MIFTRLGLLVGLIFAPHLLQAQPANNDFQNAEIISGLSGSVSHQTEGSTKELGEPDHGGDPGGASIWFLWEAPASGTAEFGLHASTFDTVISAYAGTSLDSLTPLAQNSDEFDYFPLVSRWLIHSFQSRIRFPVQAGHGYHIAVDGAGAVFGRMVMDWNLKPPPANDHFAQAQVITGAEGFISTHNVGATKEPGEPLHAGHEGSASLWYRWTAPTSGTTRFSTLNSLTSLPGALDTMLAIYTGGSLETLNLVAANDNNGTSLRSLVQFTATAGTAYQIAVDTKATSTNHGHIVLTWAHGTPANNNFANAQILNGSSGFVQGHSIYASKEPGEPMITDNDGGASIWYSWTAPANGPALFTTLGSPFFDTTLGVFTGSTLQTLHRVTENDDVLDGFSEDLTYSRVEFAASAGTTYRIAIDGFNSGTAADSGVSFLQWASGPATNDNFVKAQLISGLSGTISGCNSFASKEAGEPAHGGKTGGKSIWYRWEAPASGLVIVDLAGSLFDTLLAAYRADGEAAVNQLTKVRENDDQFDGFNLSFHSRIEFTALTGVTYYIAVDGAGDGDGYISDGWLILNYHLYPASGLQMVRSGQNVLISWNPPYRLESSPVLNGSGPSVWTPVSGTSPLKWPLVADGNRYFRTVSP